jgi:hypothetical protein
MIYLCHLRYLSIFDVHLSHMYVNTCNWLNGTTPILSATYFHVFRVTVDGVFYCQLDLLLRYNNSYRVSQCTPFTTVQQNSTQGWQRFLSLSSTTTIFWPQLPSIPQFFFEDSNSNERTLKFSILNNDLSNSTQLSIMISIDDDLSRGFIAWDLTP